MRSSGGVHHFDGPEAFAARIQNTHGRLRPAQRGTYIARLTQVRLPCLHPAMVEERLGRHFTCQVTPDRVFFRLKHFGDPPGTRNGQEETAGTVQVDRRATEVDDRTVGPTIWRSLSVPLHDLAVRAETQAGRAAPPLLGEGVAARNSQAVLRRASAFIAANPARPIALAELCAAARCSAKTLETVFRAAFGTTPNRHLRLRRLWMARRLLSDETRKNATVAQIALDCGFWELGRFAVAYRAQFGESPSQTLRAGRTPPAY